MSPSAFPPRKPGLRSGDLIVSIDGNPVTTWYQLVDAVHASDGQPLNFVVLRGRSKAPHLAPDSGLWDCRAERLSNWRFSEDHEGFEREGVFTAAKDATSRPI